MLLVDKVLLSKTPKFWKRFPFLISEKPFISKTQRLAALQSQVKRLDRRITSLQQRSNHYATRRFSVFIAVCVAVAIAYLLVNRAAAGVIALVGFGIFAGMVNIHQWIKTSLEKHLIWRQIKQTHIARIEINWEGLPEPLYQPETPHFIETDLDLRLLHQLLDTTSSQEGSERLRNWLLPDAPDLAVISERQALLRELSPRPLFRDKLTLLGRLAAADEQAEGHKITRWLAQITSVNLRPVLVGLSLLAALNIALFLLYSAEILPPFWVITWFLYAGILLNQGRTTSTLLGQALTLNNALYKLIAVLGYIEQYPYPPALRQHCQPILIARPSQQLRRLGWLIAGASVQRNPYLWALINAVIPWDVLIAVQLSQHQQRLANYLPGWLDIWFELEALCALANFVYLNPEYNFPQFTDQSQFYAIAIGHPLIPHTRKVINDFTLQQTGQVVIITGSNMAGKSSFLRTLGVNLCLAYAGSVVNAKQLDTGLFRLFTCIRVTDSLNDGISYFYAEVRRLKALLDALHTPHREPLFFLIDEIFRGTNNRERLIGSRAYIQALIGGNGLGLIATHDLELVTLAEQYPSVQNYHFREEVVEGEMHFDYRLRSGPSPTTNALKIMQLAGLPVES